MNIDKDALRLLLIVTLITLVITSIVGCNQLAEGEVIDKAYEPERDYMMLLPMHVGETLIMVPYFIHDEEDYLITIKGYNKDNEKRIETFYVTPQQYACLNIGDTFIITEDCSKEDNNNTKTKKEQ